MRGMMVGLALLGLFGPAAAQDAGALLTCPGKKDDRERLACFDAAMKATMPPAAEQPATTPTKEIVAAPANAATATVYKVVDPEDVYVAPNKYEGRGVELRRMRCFHADKNEYRCVAPGAVTLAVFAPTISPDDEREKVEADCGEIKKMATSPKCEKTIRFVPAKNVEDLVNGYRKRVVVVAPVMELSTASRGRR